jgi:hypothetical protein
MINYLQGRRGVLQEYPCGHAFERGKFMPLVILSRNTPERKILEYY